MDHIEKKVDKISDVLREFVETCDKKYATKDEHKTNSDKIDSINKVLQKLNWLVIAAVVGAVLVSIFK